MTLNEVVPLVKSETKFAFDAAPVPVCVSSVPVPVTDTVSVPVAAET